MHAALQSPEYNSNKGRSAHQLISHNHVEKVVPEFDADYQCVRYADYQCVRYADYQCVRYADSQCVRYADSHCVRYADYQCVRYADHQYGTTVRYVLLNFINWILYFQVVMHR